MFLDCYITFTAQGRLMKVHRPGLLVDRCSCGKFAMTAAVTSRIEWIDPNKREDRDVCYLSMVLDAWVHKLPPEFKATTPPWSCMCACGKKELTHELTTLVDFDTKPVNREPEEERPTYQPPPQVSKPGREVTDLFNEEENQTCV